MKYIIHVYNLLLTLSAFHKCLLKVVNITGERKVSVADVSKSNAKFDKLFLSRFFSMQFTDFAYYPKFRSNCNIIKISLSFHWMPSNYQRTKYRL